MKTVILAAGYATRLEPLTLTTPKPLLKVGGRPIIERILEKVWAIKGDIEGVVVVTNAKFFGVFTDWAKGYRLRNKISFVNDGSTTNDNRLGAIRDIVLAIDQKKIDSDLLLIAGDNLFDVDLDKFVSFAHNHSDGVSVALHEIGSREEARNFGVVRIDDRARAVEFQEKPKEPNSTLISTGIYYFPKNKLSFIKDYVKMQDKLDAPGYCISWIAGVDKVYGFTFLEDWYDIGNIESYRKADAEYLKKEKGGNGKA